MATVSAPGSPVENRKIFTTTARAERTFSARSERQFPRRSATPTSVDPVNRKTVGQDGQRAYASRVALDECPVRKRAGNLIIRAPIRKDGAFETALQPVFWPAPSGAEAVLSGAEDGACPSPQRCKVDAGCERREVNTTVNAARWNRREARRRESGAAGTPEVG